MKKVILSALFLAGVSTGALAQTATTTMTVSATVAPACSANAAVTAAFGSFADRVTEKSTTTALLVSCTSTLTNAPTVKFGGGQNQQGSDRFMRGTANAVNRLRYDLKNGANLIAINAATGETMASNGLNAYRLDFIASILPAYLTSTVADAYTDTVTVTINW
jgi:spore coat protein U-like protein